MSDEKLSLQAGIAFMERCLDAELSSQRAVAHSAIDMDDWDKAQEILAKSKEAISRVEVLRGKFAEFKKAAAGIAGASVSAPAPAAPASATTAQAAPAPAAQKPEEPTAAAQAAPAPAAQTAPAPAAQKPEEPAPAAQAATASAAPKPTVHELEPQTAPAAQKPAEPAPAAAEPAKTEFSFAAAVEELIEKHPYAMAVCNAAPNMNYIFTYDEAIAKQDMKKAVQLSNGMWAETAIPEDKARLITEALRKYCESRKQG